MCRKSQHAQNLSNLLHFRMVVALHEYLHEVKVRRQSNRSHRRSTTVSIKSQLPSITEEVGQEEPKSKRVSFDTGIDVEPPSPRWSLLSTIDDVFDDHQKTTIEGSYRLVISPGHFSGRNGSS